MFGEEYLYDTPYHLSDRGVELRTRQLLPSLREALAR
jgi:hypothetical protein